MMEAVGSCETSVHLCQATQCHVAEDTTLHELHCGELLKTNGVCKELISAIHEKIHGQDYFVNVLCFRSTEV